MQSACIVDLDDGAAVPADIADRWEALWTGIDRGYGGFSTRAAFGVGDWTDTLIDVQSGLLTDSTRYQAEARMVQAIASLHDAHVLAMSDHLCSLSPVFLPSSDVGACVIESDGHLLVSRVASSDPGLAPGDEIVAIDERTIESLIRDADVQPRCLMRHSSEPQRRANAVANLMLRHLDGETASVRAPDGEERTVILHQQESLLTCDPVLGPGDDVAVEERADGVRTAVLPGDVRWLAFSNFMGANNQGGSLHETLPELVVDAGSRAGLIIDLRGNGGGLPSVLQALLGPLVDEDLPYLELAMKSGAAHDALSAFQTQVIHPDATRHIEVPVAVLLDARGLSAVDYGAAALQAARDRGDIDVTFVGEPAAGAFGAAADISTDGFTAYVSPVFLRTLEGEPMEGRPIPFDDAHDVRAVQTAADLAAGLDTVLEAAREVIVGG